MKHETFPVTRTDDEWRRLLTPEQYAIMRQHGTERAGSCALNYEKRAGTFSCAGCGQPLFVSKTKFESGTGWPSFNDPLSGLDRDHGRPQLRHEPDRGALRALRLASRPCLPRRSAADASALLHQRRCDELQAGLSLTATAALGQGRAPRVPCARASRPDAFRGGAGLPAGHTRSRAVASAF